jgi:site-specific recombinase XerD
MTWPDAIGSFGRYLLEEEKSEHTRRNYTEDLGLFATWYQGHYDDTPDPGALGATELREWKHHLASTLKLMPATVNRKLAGMRSFLRWTIKEGIGREVQAPKSIRQEKPAPRWLSRKEQLGLLRAVERLDNGHRQNGNGRRNGAVVRILLHTGLRADELAELQWGDVQISERKGSLTVRQGKGRKYRDVPLNAEARSALVGLTAGKGESPVVPGQRGGVTAWTIHAIVTSFAERAKLPDLTPHVLRHTFCRRLAESGARLEQIAALAGHESLDTTRRYVEPGREELTQAVDRLAGED